MVRTEIRVPAGIVTYAGVFMPASSAGCGSLGSELVGSFSWSLASLSESNLSETMSARLYFCTEEPTWKLISLSVPPMNLPLISLPFFSSKEPAHASDAPSHRAMTNPQCRFNFTLISPCCDPLRFSGLIQLGWLWILQSSAPGSIWLDRFPERRPERPAPARLTVSKSPLRYAPSYAWHASCPR